MFHYFLIYTYNICSLYKYFHNKGIKHQFKGMAQVIQHLRILQMQFPQNCTSWKASWLLGRMVQPHKLLQLSLHHYPNFSKGPSTILAPLENRRNSRKNNAHILKRCVIDDCRHLKEFSYKLIMVRKKS